MNYPRNVRIESEPGTYDAALLHHFDWRTWGVRLNYSGNVGAVLSVCTADGSKQPMEANDWRTRFELTIWDAETHRKIKELGLPEGGTTTLETDEVHES